MSEYPKKPRSIGTILGKYQQKTEDKYISREFQQYGYELAQELDDPKHTALYIKLAKDMPREQIEVARRFVKDATSARNKGRLFMWKIKMLKEKSKEKDDIK